MVGRSAASSQPVERFKMKQDTTFTVYSAYRQALKKHTDISIATEAAIPGVVKKSNLVYCIAGKRSLQLDVFVPAPATTNGIAILILHGGGWRSGHRSQHHPLAQQLAGRGYTCFTPEYRCRAKRAFQPRCMISRLRSAGYVSRPGLTGWIPPESWWQVFQPEVNWLLLWVPPVTCPFLKERAVLPGSLPPPTQSSTSMARCHLYIPKAGKGMTVKRFPPLLTG